MLAFAEAGPYQHDTALRRFATTSSPRSKRTRITITVRAPARRRRHSLRSTLRWIKRVFSTARVNTDMFEF